MVEKIHEENNIKYLLIQRSEQNKLYYFCYKLALNPIYTFFIQACIIINTILQSLDSYPEPSSMPIIDKINSFFSIVFITETIIKLYAFGFKYYFTDFFNGFDCFIALTSLSDFIISSIFVDVNLTAITTFRTFRLLRLFKLARSWVQLRNLLKTMGTTLIDISHFTIILFLFMYIYSLLGMELFAYKAKFDDSGNIDPDGQSEDTNFDSFL
jgi:voltage-dependent calcium channel L type alpha-1D